MPGWSHTFARKNDVDSRGKQDVLYLCKHSCIPILVRKKTLVTWVGRTDLRAPKESTEVGTGPIAQALDARPFDQVFLLSDYDEQVIEPYLKWLRGRTEADVSVVHERLSGPTEFGDIYEAAARSVQRALGRGDTALTFHLSPGTP